MEYHILTQEEITKYYPAIFKQVFGEWDAEQHPTHVVVAELEGELVGFISGYYRTPNTFHLQYGGVTPERRGKGLPRIFKEIETIFPATIYTSYVANTNTVWQRILLKDGYLVVGVRLFGNTLYVEYVKEI
jgi:hypothetical protein